MKTITEQEWYARRLQENTERDVARSVAVIDGRVRARQWESLRVWLLLGLGYLVLGLGAWSFGRSVGHALSERWMLAAVACVQVWCCLGVLGWVVRCGERLMGGIGCTGATGFSQSAELKREEGSNE